MLSINDNAPAVAREAITIKAPPEVVFDTLAAVADWPEWQDSVSRVEADTAPRVGACFRWKSGGSWITSTIETFEPPQAIGWRGKATGTRAIHVWRLTADGTATRVETEESMDGWLVSLLRGPMRKVLQRGISSALRSLKAEAERRHRAAETRQQEPRHSTRLTNVGPEGRDR